MIELPLVEEKKIAVSVVFFCLSLLWFGVFFQWVWQIENEDVCTCATAIVIAVTDFVYL